MKNIVLLACCLLIISSLHAQDKLVGFGRADKAELALKDCDFDPGAPLECLIDQGTVTYSFGGSVLIQTQVRKRFKILKDAGISKAADVKVTYYSKDGYENISGVDGYVYNMNDNGNITTSKLKRADVFDKKVDDRYSQVTFAMPDVRVGSVVEYRYTSYQRSFGNIRSWYFQKDYPVKYSAYNLVIPDYFNFTYQVNRRQDIIIKKSSGNDGNWFIMHDVASVHEEPYMSGRLDFLQRVDFNLTSVTPPGEATIEIGTTWQKQMEDYLDTYDAGGQLKRNVHHPDELNALVAACKDNSEKLRTVYQYIQKYMKCTDEEAFYSEDGGIKEAWDKKQGSIADINFLLINWLRDYKITAYPLLVSTHENGAPNPAYVDIGQFDAVMVYAEADSTPYVMNAADKYAPYDLVPYNINFSSALIVDPKNSRWININDAKKKYATQGVVNLNIAKDGKVSGFANLSFYDYARSEKMKAVKDGNIKSKFSLDKNIVLNVDSFEVKNEKDDNAPLSLDLNVSGAAKNSGNYLLIPYNLYSGLSENPFTADKRQTFIQFDVLHSFSITGYINIDSGLAFEELPKNIAMRIGDSSILIRRIFQKNSDNMISYMLSVNFLTPTYPLDEYADIKAFYKKLFELLDERIVIKRTSK